MGIRKIDEFRMWRMMSNDTFFDSLDPSGENDKKISLTIGPIFELRG